MAYINFEMHCNESIRIFSPSPFPPPLPSHFQIFFEVRILHLMAFTLCRTNKVKPQDFSLLYPGRNKAFGIWSPASIMESID